MPVKTYKLGPGTLKLGELGVRDISAQVRSLRLRCNVTVQRTDPVPVLSGESVPGTITRTYEWSLEGAVLQDIDADGLTEWTWANKGSVEPFEFIPNTAKGRAATGVTVVAPLDYGGDLGGARPEAPIAWPAGGTVNTDGDDVTGDPVLGAAPVAP
jgi:hypothetical protein